MSVLHEIPALEWSDGTESQHPARDTPLRPCPADAENTYLTKLGVHLAKLYNKNPKLIPSAGGAKFSESASLAALPAGYKLFEQPRGGGTKHYDRYLYGHPG